HIPPATLEQLLTLAQDGATVLFMARLPGDVPGLSHLDDQRARLANALREVALSAPRSDGVQRAAFGRGQVLVAPTPELALDLAGVHRERLTDFAGLGLIRRRRPNGYDYFVANHGRDSIGGWVPLAVRAASVAIMDPLSLRTGLAESHAAADGGTELRLDLAVGESRILRIFDGLVSAPRWRYERAS